MADEATLCCSFCGKKPTAIEMLMSSNDQVHICNECIFIGMVWLVQTTDIDFEDLVEQAKKHPPLGVMDLEGDGSD